MHITPKISNTKAEAILSRRSNAFSSIFSRQPVALTRLELIYLPYFIYEISIKKALALLHVTVAVDGLLGTTALIDGNQLKCEPSPADRSCSFLLDSPTAQDIAIQMVRAEILQYGLRTRKTSSFEKVNTSRQIYYPFWIGYFRKGRKYDFKACDAVSGTLQGVRMRKVFLCAFRLMSKNSNKKNR